MKQVLCKNAYFEGELCSNTNLLHVCVKGEDKWVGNIITLDEMMRLRQYLDEIIEDGMKKELGLNR